MKKSILMLSVMLLLSGCDIMNKIGGAYQLSQSEYRYRSVNNIQLSGLNLGDASGISLSNLATIATILSGGSGMQSIPFSLTLNMDVTNPNTTAAFLDALDYAIQINEMEFVEGKMDIPIRIEPGETKVVGVPISVDLKALMNRYSQERVSSEMSGFLGITPNKTAVSVKLWPKFFVGETLVKVPAPIPVVFNFGGK
ncbi:MAG: LEA type 2 family protein [bacterium]|nr:LEA type 2 family protein [bacterium]MDD3624874.1 LEA type 2 family protein [Proteiniphilum sp.]MDD3967937.1 LEA type 2 family protein [Proteiniphilum sp.]MDD4459266.1 LEA type 2 family protein [Proteiniphilum sp.]